MVVPKFRAWDTFRNKWVKYFYITENGLIYNIEQPHWDLIGAIPIEKSGLVVMQSTGLFDKNGKEIFEGDVFTYLDDDNNPIYENIVVKFGQHTNMDTIYERGPVYIGLYVETQKGTATLEIDSMYNDCEGRLTIIGNIYENPELVEW
ncbi:YopX family protein [Streptococcus suis]|uniref:YopX protein n=1 Tax=Streptococcus suis TaxID=1307 RepID=A0A116QW21_STRSU|nr:YopX family protein [Streptococcus suis]NQR95555.1 hypothetical protein [Streptococcus suis]CYX34634.1 YopX protein [Streptococcus suis]HEM3164592.1 hypothetical protein [Streptococcus suis 92-1191]